MKRCFSLALVLALLLTAIACPAPAEEVVSGNVEAEVAPAQAAGDTGLTVDGEAADAGFAVEAEPDAQDAPQAESEAALFADIEDGAEADPEAILTEGAAETPKALVAIEVSPSKIAIGVGETYAGLRATAPSPGSVVPKVTWTTSSKKVAWVDAETGAITGVREGTCSVTATAANGKTATCTVTVAKKPGKVTLSKRELSLSEGMTATLKASLPSGTASGALTYKSSKPGCVTVDENGNLTALAAGNATITVSTYNGKTAKCKVTVYAAPAAVNLPAGEALCIAVGQKVGLKASAADASGQATPAGIAYAVDESSPDAGCVKLNRRTGSVRGVRRGQAVVVVTAHNGVAARCTVTVDVAPKSVKLNQSSISIGRGEKYAGLAAILTPPKGSDTCATAVTWTSSDRRVAKVDASGRVTGVKTGSCTIKVKASNGKTAKCTVTVAKKPGKVTLSKRELSLSEGMTARLKASLPSGTASGALTFNSDKPECVTVDVSGNLTALAPGSATITASTYHGKTAQCKVTVCAAPAAVNLPAGDALCIAVGQKVGLKASAADASGQATPAGIAYAVDESSPDAGCIKLNRRTGAVQGVRQGQAVVVVTAHNGVEARCTVTVDVAPASVKLNRDAVAIGLGEVYAGLIASCTPPEGAATCATAVAWTSSDKAVATVSASGQVTGVAKGLCTITATAANGASAACVIAVRSAPAKIAVSPAVGALKVGQTGQYKVALSPDNSASRLFYRSSDEAVADVDEDGFVTAIAPGEVDITVSTFNGLSRTVSLMISEDDGTGDDDGGDGDGGKTSPDNAKKLQYVITVALSQLGKPYVYGSGYSTDSDPRGFDCSGLVYWCFLHIDIRLKDTAYRQGYDESLKKITDKNDLRRGDLVFFDTVSDGDLSDHSAIYLGSGKFIHASSSKQRVIVSDMSEAGSYYDRAFSWGRRVLE